MRRERVTSRSGEPGGGFARFSSVKPHLFPQKAKRREHNMRLITFLASDRLVSRQLMLGVETLLALTLCLLVVRAVTQL
jgi:hypothetical protein